MSHSAVTAAARYALIVLVSAVLASVLLIVPPVLAAGPLNLQPGERVTVTCESGLFVGPHTATEIELLCAPTDAPTATPTASATATPTPQPTTSPPSPTLGTTPSPSPSPTSTPSPSPSSSAPPPSSTSCADIQGHGSETTGGTNVITVSTVSALRSAIESGNHVRLSGGTYDVNGRLDLPSNLTLEAVPGQKAVIRGGLFIRGSSNIIIRDLAIRASDAWGSAGDLDAITLNGLNDPVNDIAISNVTAIWGPDIGGIAILGDVNDVTVQCSILGEGLRFSDHHEGNPPEGHSMGLSVFQLDSGVDPADRLTFWGNLLTTSDRRMPVIHGARLVDWVNNASYNWGRNGPDGNPRSLNYIGNVVKAGPLSDTSDAVWRSRPHSANPCCYANSVYLADNLAVGLPYRESLSSGVKVSSPFSLSVTPFPASDVEDFIVSNAGPIIRDATDDRLIDNFVDGTGGYMDADDLP